MAVIYDPNLNNKNKTQQFGQQVGGQSSIIQAPEQSAQPKSPQGSGSFTNLQKMLGANQGAGTKMASQVSQIGQQQAQQVASQQQKAQQQTQAAVNEEKSLQSQASEIGQAIAATKNAEGLNTLIANKGAAIGGLVDDTTKLDKANQNLTNALSQSSTGINKIQATQQALGSEAGRAQLMQNLVRRPTYGRGMSALDQALMQSQGKDILQQTRANLGQQAQNLQKTQEELGALGNQMAGLQTSASDISKSLQSGLQGVNANIESDLDVRAKSAQEAANAERQAYIQRMAQAQGTAEDFSKLGINEGQRLYNYDLGDKALQNMVQANQFNKADVVGKSDVQAFSALKDLLGSSSQYSLPTEAKAAMNVSDAQKQAIQQGLEEQQKAFENMATRTNIKGTSVGGMFSATPVKDIKANEFLKNYKGPLTEQALRDMSAQDYDKITNTLDKRLAAQYYNKKKGWVYDPNLLDSHSKDLLNKQKQGLIDFLKGAGAFNSVPAKKV